MLLRQLVDVPNVSSMNMRFAPRAHWMVIFQFLKVLVSLCHVGD